MVLFFYKNIKLYYYETSIEYLLPAVDGGAVVRLQVVAAECSNNDSKHEVHRQIRLTLDGDDVWRIQ